MRYGEASFSEREPPEPRGRTITGPGAHPGGVREGRPRSPPCHKESTPPVQKCRRHERNKPVVKRGSASENHRNHEAGRSSNPERTLEGCEKGTRDLPSTTRMNFARLSRPCRGAPASRTRDASIPVVAPPAYFFQASGLGTCLCFVTTKTAPHTPPARVLASPHIPPERFSIDGAPPDSTHRPAPTPDP